MTAALAALLQALISSNQSMQSANVLMKMVLYCVAEGNFSDAQVRVVDVDV